MTLLQDTRRGEVTVRDLSKSFALNGQRLNVLRNLHLDIQSGEALAIVGPSGCGKTTLLRILAGLDRPDAGEVLIDGHPVQGVGTERAVIFQEPRLLPWLTVLGNVAFGLAVRGLPQTEAEIRARHYIRLVGLAEFETAYPRQLSGGMAQRVGIARGPDGATGNPSAGRSAGRAGRHDEADHSGRPAPIWRNEKGTMFLGHP